MKYIILTVLIFTFINLHSQNDSIYKSIVQYDDSASLIINKGRKLLLAKFVDKDYKSMSEILNYLESKENKDYIALYPVERWLLDYWTEEYGDILQTTIKFDSSYYASFNYRIRPQYDLLYMKLYQTSKQEQASLTQRIDNSNFNQSEKDFLKLNLSYCTVDKNKSPDCQDTLNTLTNSYISTYPKSEFIPYAKKYIRFQYIPRKFGLGIEFFSGIGLFTNQLYNSFGNHGVFGFAIDYSYNDWIFYFRDYLGFSSLRQDLVFKNTTWTKGSSADIFLPEFSVGYVFFENSRIKLSPFIGISSSSISPPSQDQTDKPELKNVGLDFTTTYTFGFNADFKFKMRTPFRNSKNLSYYGIRLRYGFNMPQFSNHYSGYDGYMSYITIGFNMFGRGMKKDN